MSIKLSRVYLLGCNSVLFKKFGFSYCGLRRLSGCMNCRLSTQWPRPVALKDTKLSGQTLLPNGKDHANVSTP